MVLFYYYKNYLFEELRCAPQSCTYTIQTDHISQDNEVS